MLMIILARADFFSYSKPWITYAIVFNTIFLLDLIAHIVLFGFKRLMKRKKEYFWELILQIIATIIIICYLTFD